MMFYFGLVSGLLLGTALGVKVGRSMEAAKQLTVANALAEWKGQRHGDN
jgi:hypothetical protein